jgi:hypothetical protein
MKTKNIVLFAGFVSLMISAKAVNPEELFPELENWSLKIDETVYVPDNLWELINGAAEIYLAYEFQDLHIGEYTNERNEMIQVELYRHRNPENTFGIYSAERMPDYQFNAIGVEGYTSFGTLNFFSGNYYVKIVWSGTGDANDKILAELAEKIEKKLNQDNKWPDILTYFPDQYKIPFSEGYSNENFLGYSYLHSAFTTGYKIDDKEFKLFIIRLNSNHDVVQTIDKYFGTINFKPSGEMQEDFIVRDPYNGRIGIGMKDCYLFGTYDLEDEQLITQYLNQIRMNIDPLE